MRRLRLQLQQFRHGRGRLQCRRFLIFMPIAVVPDLFMRRHLEWPRSATMDGPARTVAFPSACGRIEGHDPSWLSRLRGQRDPLFHSSTPECAHSRELIPQPREMLLR